MSSSVGSVFLTVFTTTALGALVFYLLQRLKVAEARLALLDQKTRQSVDVGEVKGLFQKEIPNIRRLVQTVVSSQKPPANDGKAPPPGDGVLPPPPGPSEAPKAAPRLTFGAAPAVQGPVRRLEDVEDEEEKVPDAPAAAAPPGAD